MEPEEDAHQVKVAATTGDALEDKDKAEAAANASAAQQAGAKTETEEEDAEEGDAPTELPTAERAVMVLGVRPARWSQRAKTWPCSSIHGERSSGARRR